MQISQATQSDLQEIQTIINFYIQNSTAIYDYDNWDEALTLSWFDNKNKMNFPVYVAKENNKVIGFASYGTFRNKIGFSNTVEHSLYIAQGHEAKGVGKMLLKTLINHAQKAGIKTMIGVVDATNTSSIAFHQKMGFTNQGTLTNVGFKFGKWLSVTFMQKEF